MHFLASVRDYGAMGDGIADDTYAFETALGAIRRRGGGTLFVEGGALGYHGIYLIRPIRLTSHLIIIMGKNSTLLGLPDEGAWPLLPPLPSYGQGRGGGAFRRASLLQGISLHNVTIQGHGYSSVVDGQGTYWWERIRNHTIQYNAGHLIEFMHSTNIRIQNIRMMNSPSWNNHFYDCDNVHVRDVDIWAPESSPYTDGWDPDSSRNVLIEDSTYSAGDDCVAIKSGWDCYGIDYGKPSVNITVRNLTCHGYSAGIAIGSEMSGGIENVTIERVRFTKSNKPADIKVGKTRGGYVRNVIFRDIVVDGPIQRAIHVDLFHYNDSPNPSCPDNWKPDKLTEISNLTFVRWDGSRATYYDYQHRPNETYHFTAYPESPIHHVFMEDVHFPTNGLAWNCSAVHGVVRGNSVSPWPPCEGFSVESEFVSLDRSSNCVVILPIMLAFCVVVLFAARVMPLKLP